MKDDNKLFDVILKENVKNQKKAKEKSSKKIEEKHNTDNEVFVKDIITEVITEDQIAKDIDLDKKTLTEMIFDKTQVLIMKLIQENPKLSVDEIAQQAGITRQDAIDNLRSLIAKGMLLRVAGQEEGYWEVTYHYRDMY